MIAIVRHGQTEQNNALLLQGRSDNELDDIGKKQSADLAKWFREHNVEFDLIYSSPLKRAVETAEIITGNAEVVTDNRLIEMDYGPYEGMDLHSLSPEVAFFFSDFVNHPAPEGMEPLSEVVRRLGEFLEDIRPVAENKNILISTHAIAMKGALEYLTPESKGKYWSTHILNCEVYRTDVVDGEYSIPFRLELI